MTPNAPQLVTTQADWDKIAQELKRADRIAIDLEGNGFFRYPERICLIQLCAKERIFLLDPLTVGDLKALGELLANPKIEKIFHSCDWDLRVLQKDLGFQVRNIFDTSLAARFMGINQSGLGNVLKTLLGVELNKSKALQRQDWTLRPLPPESIAYASEDVHYLLPLRMLLAKGLKELGRLSWVEEEFVRLEAMKVSPPIPPEERFWNIKGSRRLPPKQRAVLRELYLFRERLACQLDRPPFKVVSDDCLLALAAEPGQEFQKLRGWNLILHLGKRDELKILLQHAAQLPGLHAPANREERPAKPAPEVLQRLTALKTWRVEKGKTLNLDPSLLWPLRNLEILAEHPLNTVRELIRMNEIEVRAWQREVFANELYDAMLAAWQTKPGHLHPAAPNETR